MYSAYYFSYARPMSEQYQQGIYAIEQQFLRQISQFLPPRNHQQDVLVQTKRDNQHELIKKLFS